MVFVCQIGDTILNSAPLCPLQHDLVHAGRWGQGSMLLKMCVQGHAGRDGVMPFLEVPECPVFQEHVIGHMSWCVDAIAPSLARLSIAPEFTQYGGGGQSIPFT